FAAADADAAFSCITPSLTRFMSWAPPASRDEFAAVWRAWLPKIDDGSDYVFAIRQRDDRQFLGLAGLHHAASNSPELGIWIREDRHGAGFGSEAVRLVVQWASQVLAVDHFIYPVAEHNHPSRRIAESLGGVIMRRHPTPKYASVTYRIPQQSELAQR
ncbi:MAG: GNAT family N-acetyltransferase, partial [Burkholderiaceae bacterium]|nr:GNAT family N-acetyltransferase [Burkholderiaceae bacterium]